MLVKVVPAAVGGVERSSGVTADHWTHTLAAHQSAFEFTAVDVQNAPRVVHSSNTAAPRFITQSRFIPFILYFCWCWSIISVTCDI